MDELVDTRGESVRTQRSMDRDSVADAIAALGPHIHSPVPNPAPLGLFSFGLTTAILQMKHTRLAGKETVDMNGVENLAWGFALFYGGLLQFVAGLGEVRRNNLFGYTAFCSYGGFWMSLGTAEILVNFYSDNVGINPKALQAVLALMGIFTFILWICTFEQNKVLCLLIFSLMMTFLLLAAGVDNKTTDYVAGWVGLFTASVAFFLASAELINDILGGGRELIPLGAFEANRFKFAGHFHVPGRIHGSHFGPDHNVSPVPSSRSINRRHVQISSSNDYLGAPDTLIPNSPSD